MREEQENPYVKIWFENLWFYKLSYKFELMETPPNTGPHRPNYMHFRRGEGEEEMKNEPPKFGPSKHLAI